MEIRFPWQQNHLWILIALTNKCTKYELYLTSKCKVIDRLHLLPWEQGFYNNSILWIPISPNEQMYQM